MNLREKYNSLIKETDYNIKVLHKNLKKYRDKYDKYAEEINELVRDNKNLFDMRFNMSEIKKIRRKK